MNTQVRRLVTKIAKLRYAAKSAYCVEVLSFLHILKDRDVSDQIVDIPEDKAQRLYQVQLNNNNVVKELCVRGRGISWNVQGGGIFLEGGGPEVTEKKNFYFFKYGYYALVFFFKFYSMDMYLCDGGD